MTKLPVILGYRVYPAGGAEIFIRESLRELVPYVSGTIVTVSNWPWNGPKFEHDRSLSFISDILLNDVYTNVEIVKDDWKDENYQGSWLLERAYQKYPGMYLLMIDCDEVITKETLEEGLKNIGEKPGLMFHHRCYWKTIRHKILPDFHVSALGLIKLDKVRKIVRHRHLEVEDYAYLPVEKGFCHHFAYVRNNETIKQKLSTFSHASEIVPNWYEEKWLGWDKNNNLTNLHPVAPEKWTGVEVVKKSTLPGSLSKVLSDEYD